MPKVTRLLLNWTKVYEPMSMVTTFHLLSSVGFDSISMRRLEESLEMINSCLAFIMAFLSFINDAFCTIHTYYIITIIITTYSSRNTFYDKCEKLTLLVV